MKLFPALWAAAALMLGGCSTSNLLLLDTLPPAKPLDAQPRFQQDLQGQLEALSPLARHGDRAPAAGERQVDVVQLLAGAAPGTWDVKNNQITLSNGTTIPVAQTEASYAELLQAFEKSSDDDAKTSTRNLIVGQLVDASISNCGVYLKSLDATQAASRAFFDIVTGGLSAAGGVTTPARAAQLLSALAGFANGAGASIDRDLFAETSIPIVAAQIGRSMVADRTSIEQAETLPYSRWDLSTALGDVKVLYLECSLVSGFQKLQDVVAKRDADLKAARAAAAQVMSAGGSAAEVNAALAGVVNEALDEGGESDIPRVGAAPSSLWRGDLNVIEQGIDACLTSSRQDLTKSDSVTAQILTAEEKTFSDCLQTKVLGLASAPTPAASDWAGLASTATSDFNVAADAEAKQATAAIAGAAVTTFFSSLTQTVDADMERIIGALASRRNGMAQALRAWAADSKANPDATAVVTFLRSYAGLAPTLPSAGQSSSNGALTTPEQQAAGFDPVFDSAIAAAFLAKSDPSHPNAQRAAAEALGAAEGAAQPPSS